MSYIPQASAANEMGPATSVQQAKKISGNVSDDQGPLIGATVMEKGTSNGVVTDIDGNFIINVNPGATLIFSYIGYLTQEVVVGNQTNIIIKLQEEGHSLNEVVVIGYGTQRKEAVTGSVVSLGGDKMREVPGAELTQAMQGRIAGVQMMQTSSKPGASMQIRIRGTRSLTASNDPLIVLDGIPFAGSINDIDPNNIKSMDILKDASATAIYGSRGANGVILITTYKGYQEQKPTVTYNGYIGLKMLFHRYPMMNAEQFSKLRKYANKFQNGVDETYWGEERAVDTDWQDMLFENGLTTNQDVGISGGSAHGSYNFGLAYYRDEAVIPGQNFNRYSMHAAIDQEIGNFVKIGFSTNSNYSVTNGANLGLYNTLSATPIANPYNEDGTLKERVQMSNDTQWVYAKETLDGLGDRYKDQTKAYGTYNNFYGEVKIPGVDGLKYRLNLGLNYRHSDYGNYTGQGVFADNANTSSTAVTREQSTTNWAVENILTYDKTWGKHTINAVALYSAEQTTFKQSQINALDIPADAFQFYNMGQAGSITVNPDNQRYYKSGLESFMGRLMYNYDNRYMASIAFRSDGSSRLAKGHKWHTYPAVSLGWNISREAFMANATWIDNLKIRVGYGETSNQSVDPYKTLGVLSTRPYNFGTTNTVGVYVSELPSPELGWEYSKTWNLGLDWALWAGRLSGTFEYYIQNTEDLLMSVNLPASAGVPSYMANVGKTRNKGFEASVTGIIIDNKNGWTWEAGLNFYSNKNKLVELTSGSDRDESNWWFVGQPINVIYDYEKIGIWQQDEEEARQIAEPGGNAGMIKIRYNGEYDENGLPTRAYGSEDRQIIKVDPSWEGGFNTRVAYKNWDLSLVASFRHGGTLISTIYGSQGYLNMLTGRRNNIDVDYWTEDNPTNAYPKPGGIESSNNPKYGNSLGYFSASYLKVRTITLGYNFNQPWLKKAGITKARVYATIQNPFVLFSPYHDESGMDPETNSYGDENQAVTSFYKQRLLVVGYNTPSTRNWLLGLNITF
ncbi:MAG: TonB-dependent receptor [Prevotella sp.]|nr:TonB-dependent receptor [Prevotella sp.]